LRFEILENPYHGQPALRRHDSMRRT
jgi:hypothetical protein